MNITDQCYKKQEESKLNNNEFGWNILFVGNYLLLFMNYSNYAKLQSNYS